MKFSRIIHKLQNAFKVSKFELAAVSIFLLGLLIAVPGLFFTKYEKRNQLNNLNSIQFFAELAAKQQTSYIGSDISGTPDTALAKGDTIASKQSLFPEYKPKTLPEGTKININTAIKSELKKIPGIGEVTADKILDYRSNKKFSKIEDIMNINGIGEKKFEKMKKYIVVK